MVLLLPSQAMKPVGLVVTGHLLALPSQGTKPTGAGTNGPGRRSVFLGCKTKHGQVTMWAEALGDLSRAYTLIMTSARERD